VDKDDRQLLCALPEGPKQNHVILNQLPSKDLIQNQLTLKHIVFGSSASVSPGAPLVLGEIHRIGFDRRTEI